MCKRERCRTPFIHPGRFRGTFIRVHVVFWEETALKPAQLARRSGSDGRVADLRTAQVQKI